jgi:phosphatidylglycerophosphatase GEP4
MPWDMRTLNVSATLNIFRVLANPSLCLPHATVSTFNDLPVPLNTALEKYGKVDIRAVILDKDDCFAKPHENEVYKPYRVRRRISCCKLESARCLF